MTFICKFSPADIEAILSEYESGADRRRLCARHCISVRTLFRWQAKAGRSGPVLRRLVKQLRDENDRLRESVAGQVGVAIGKSDDNAAAV